MAATDYRRHNANPAGAAAEMPDKVLATVGDDEPIGVGITGSVGMGYAEGWHLRFEQEVVAAAEVVKRLYPTAHTLVDIGGEAAKKAGRSVIMLAARPYHINPQIQHRIAASVAAMGIDVITENAAAHAGCGVYGEQNALCQWVYPNRIFKAAYMVAQSPYTRLHMVELTSFGCGPDAFILDEVRIVRECSIEGIEKESLTVVNMGNPHAVMINEGRSDRGVRRGNQPIKTVYCGVISC